MRGVLTLAVVGVLHALIFSVSRTAGRDVGAAVEHTKEAGREMKRAGEALTEPNEQHYSMFHLPRWARRDDAETGFDANAPCCDEEDEDSVSLLQRTLHSMRTFGKSFGIFSEDEAMDDLTDGLGLDYRRTRPSYMEEEGESLGNRVIHFFNLTRRFHLNDNDEEGEQGFGHGLKASAFEMSHELQKELGMEKKTLKDKIIDVAEALHLKEPSSEKAAAKKVAGAFDSTKESIEELKQQTGGKVDSLLKALHIRSPSTLEKATQEYQYALHRIKVSPKLLPALAFLLPSHDVLPSHHLYPCRSATQVALGQESPYASEKLTGALSNARNNAFDLLYGARDYINEGEVGIKERWNNMLARTTASVIDARDTASHAIDQALKNAGIKEKSRMEKARDRLDLASHKLLRSLGVHEPSTMEKLKCYSYNALHPSDTIVCEGIGIGMKDTTLHPAQKGGVVDRVLKALHLREKNSYEKASDAFDAGLHKVKVLLGQEEPSVNEKVEHALGAARAEMRALGKQLSHAIPPSLGGSKPSSFEQLSDSTKASYYKALKEGGKRYATVRKNLDSALKKAGIKDETTLDKINHGIKSSYHDFAVQLGLQEPSALDVLSDWAHPLKPTMAKRSDSIWSKTARILHLQPKTAAESARDAYYQSLHNFKALTGQEDRTVTEKLHRALDDSQKWVAHSVSSVGQGVSDASDAAAANAMKALLEVQSESNRLLKKAGLKEKSKIEKAKDALDESTAALWSALGFHEPTLLDRVKMALIKSGMKVAGAKGGHTVEVLLDPHGELQPGVFQRLAEKVGLH